MALARCLSKTLPRKEYRAFLAASSDASAPNLPSAYSNLSPYCAANCSTNFRSSPESVRIPWSKWATTSSKFRSLANKSNSTTESTPPETATTYLPREISIVITGMVLLSQTPQVVIINPWQKDRPDHQETYTKRGSW